MLLSISDYLKQKCYTVYILKRKIRKKILAVKLCCSIYKYRYLYIFGKFGGIAGKFGYLTHCSSFLSGINKASIQFLQHTSVITIQTLPNQIGLYTAAFHNQVYHKQCMFNLPKLPSGHLYSSVITKNRVAASLTF